MAMPLHDPVIPALHVSNHRPALKAIYIPFTAAVPAFIARRDTFSGRRSQISPLRQFQDCGPLRGDAFRFIHGNSSVSSRERRLEEAFRIAD